MAVELTARHVKWALAIARCTPHPDPAMCESDALLGLLRASRKFDPAIGQFEGYARERIRWAIQDGMRDEADHLSRDHRRKVKAGEVPDPGAPVSVETPLSSDNGALQDQQLTIVDTLRSAEGDHDVRISVQDALASLDSRAAAVVRMKYQGWPWQDIADLFGVGESQVCRLYRHGLSELRAALGIDSTEEMLAA